MPGSSRPDCFDYGSHCKINDTVGVLLQFKGSQASLTFFVNGSSQGVCYGDMPMQVYYPEVILYSEGTQVALNPSAVLK